MMMRLQIGYIVLLFVFSCFLTTPLLASDPVTVVIEETTIEQKTKLFVYGYAEGVDRWQEVNITLSDSDDKTLELKAETNKIGNWSAEEVDISTLSDGKITIAAVLKDEAGKTMVQTTATVVLDTSFSFAEFMKKHFAATIFILMVTLLMLGFPMKIPLIAGATLGVYLLYDGDLSQTQFMIQQMMAGFRADPPELINHARVVKIHDYQEQMTTDRSTGERLPISLPVSNVLQFILEDGSKISVRPSGTEPKIKFYFSVSEKLEKQQDKDKIQKVLNERIEKQKKSLKLI